MEHLLAPVVEVEPKQDAEMSSANSAGVRKAKGLSIRVRTFGSVQGRVCAKSNQLPIVSMPSVSMPPGDKAMLRRHRTVQSGSVEVR